MALQWVCMAAATVGAAAMLRQELQKHIEHVSAEVREIQHHVWPRSSCQRRHEDDVALTLRTRGSLHCSTFLPLQAY
jgi:hypothetical protein